MDVVSTRRAFVYTRISLDRTSEGLGVERQLKACRAKAAALGWSVVEVFEENDTSASKGRRPMFDEMMGRLASGEGRWAHRMVT
jgi:site-specific DNA recombinase